MAAWKLWERLVDQSNDEKDVVNRALAATVKKLMEDLKQADAENARLRRIVEETAPHRLEDR